MSKYDDDGIEQTSDGGGAGGGDLFDEEGADVTMPGGGAGPPGPPGPPGATGPPGAPGTDGTDGTDGVDGDDGTQGPPGGPGDDGDPGPPGAPGATGATGAVGATGPSGGGIPGPPGDDGEAGPPGQPGTPGSAGAPGATGAGGPQGPPGIPGEDGEPGSPGTPGSTGATGATGPAGADGAPGVAGAAGSPGFPGDDGADGEQGPPGNPGATGAAGSPGSTGATGSPGSPGPPGEDGEDGSTGPPGPPGPGALLLSERATQVIAAGTSFAVTDGTPVTPFTTASGSNITSTAIPLIAPGRDGQIIVIRNDNGTDAAGLIIKDTNFLANSGMRLDNDQLILEGHSTAGFIYSTILSSWVFQWYKKLKHYTGAISTFTVDGSSALTHEWGDGATANDTAPAFLVTYSGIPTAASVTITVAPDAGYPQTILTPFLSGTGAVYFRSSTRNGTRTFRWSATVNGSGVTLDVIVTYRAPNYSGVNTSSTSVSSATLVAMTHTLDIDPFGTYASIPATGATDRVWFGFVTGDATLDSTLFFSILGERAKFTAGSTNPVSVTSSFGKVQNYDTYRSDIAQLGTVTVVVQTTRPPSRRYIGSQVGTSLTEAQIEALAQTDLTESPNGTWTSITTGASERLWLTLPSVVAAPSNFGIRQQAASGFEQAGFVTASTVSVTNIYGFVDATVKTFRSSVTDLNAININGVTSGSWALSTSGSAFNRRIFMGPHAATAIASAQILTLDDSAATGSSRVAATLAASYPVNIGGSDYLWFCHPSSVSDLATIKDQSTGFAVAGSYRTNVTSHTSDTGETGLTMRVWRSDNVGIFPSGGIVDVT